MTVPGHLRNDSNVFWQKINNYYLIFPTFYPQKIIVRYYHRSWVLVKNRKKCAVLLKSLYFVSRIIYQGKKHQVRDNKSETTEEKNPSQLKRNPPKKQRTILCIYYYNNIICSHYKPWMYYILPENKSSVQDCKKYMKKIHWLKKISQDFVFSCKQIIAFWED